MWYGWLSILSSSLLTHGLLKTNFYSSVKWELYNLNHSRVHNLVSWLPESPVFLHGKRAAKNYNEAKSITFSLILFYLTWIAYFTAYLTIKSKYLITLNAVAQISSINGILFRYFIPKSYIIIFQAQKNTPAYFQTSIQNYTQTISRS